MFTKNKEEKLIANDEEFVALMTKHNLSVRDLHILHSQYIALHFSHKLHASKELEKFNDPTCQYPPLPDIVADYRKEYNER